MEQLDQQVVTLAKAIRKIESGGNYAAKGKSDEYGAYQYTPDTWKAHSSKYGISTPLEKASKEEQNQVAYKQLKEWKDKGFNVGQIASMWNAGPGRPNAYLEGHKGTNKFGVSYDTGAYAKKVAEAYQSYKGANNIPKAISEKGGYVQTANLPAPTEPALKEPGFVQGTIQGIAQPFLEGASSVRAMYNAIKGNTEKYNELETQGADYGYFGKAKPLGAGFDVTKGFSKKNLGALTGAAGQGAKAATTLATLESGAGLLKRAVVGGKAISNPIVLERVSQFLPKSETFQALSNAEKLNVLTQSLEKASASDSIVLRDAIAEVYPLAKKELGRNAPLLGRVLRVLGKTAKSAIKQTGGIATGYALGSTGKGLYNEIIR